MRFKKFMPVRVNTNFTPALDNFFDDFFKVGVPSTHSHNQNSGVNISESDSDFLIEVALPGLNKGDFNVNVEKNLLTISAKQKIEKTEEGENKGRKYTRREFGFTSFKRSFHLPESVNSDEITANYDKGILAVSLPKVAKEEPKVKTIEIG